MPIKFAENSLFSSIAVEKTNITVHTYVTLSAFLHINVGLACKVISTLNLHDHTFSSDLKFPTAGIKKLIPYLVKLEFKRLRFRCRTLYNDNVVQYISLEG